MAKLNSGWRELLSALIILMKLDFLVSIPTPIYNCVTLDGEQACHTTNPNPYRNFGSKTSYPAVYKDHTKLYNLKGCSPKVFYLLSRHATRYPGEEYIQYINQRLPILKEKIIIAYEIGRAKLCKEDIDKLKNWSPSITLEDENRLSATGAVEAEKLGERLRQRFPEILGMKYSQGRYIIEYTSKKRTRHTALNFSRGMFTEQDYEKIKGKTNDKLLRYNKDCKEKMKKCGTPKLELREFEEFSNGSLMQKVRESVSKRIGFEITDEDMTHMHLACSFGYALNISTAWCSAFSQDDLKVMEYADDIEGYYKRSYGNAINYQQACPIIKYIVELFKSYEKTRMNKVVLQFTHSGAVARFFSALGIHRDAQKLTAKNFCAQSNRKWRTSTVVPFNANIVFVLYDCNGELKIMTLHNEKPVGMDGCANDKLCSLEEFYNKYESIARSCDLNKICGGC